MKDAVETRAKEVAQALPPPSAPALYRVTLQWIQARARSATNDPHTFREDRGDLDNKIKAVFDGLGPIIGYRRRYTPRSPRAAADSRIIQVEAKKSNGGLQTEFLAIEVSIA